MVLLHIGIDDTDSKQGMCTTYVGAVAIRRLQKLGFRLKGYPKLIRLNPNWKIKTRGNCSIAFTISAKRDQIPTIKEIVLRTVEELAELHVETTNPGVVFYQGSRIAPEMKFFSKKVIQDVVTIEEAEELAKRVGAEVHKFKLGRGIVGALAAIGNALENDWTFELIAYRIPENRGTPRRIDRSSVEEMNRKTYPSTFDNLDPSTGEIRITPHTPCPILYGIRGETPQAVKKASKMVRALEPIEQIIIYKTNQGTDEHLRKVKIADAKPNWSVIVEGVVSKAPRTIPGGHVIFRLKDETGEIDCAAYEPTRQFRDKVRKFIIGDRLRVYGGIKEKPELPLTINLEKVEVLEAAPLFRKENPRCPSCGKRMKSEGKNKGYSCKRCKTKLPASSAKTIRVERAIGAGKFEVPPRARRHLAKPLIREIAGKNSGDL
ncbi:MAG: tRNA(Ile)(2)-agmatinylcytidine synthase [Candidatus Hadarchaeum sp.]|uniref:tRNA(Ile)(2)-agmatinylcytidine synthase n=1 Tax=Candidatus Hadarchaeum sp. TaxID=2883567 RepID=UPI00317CC631